MPRIAIAQLRPAKGDYNADLQKIGGVLAQVAKLDPPVDLVVFPETSTSGYFVEGGVRDVAVTAANRMPGLARGLGAGHAAPPGGAGGVSGSFPNPQYQPRPLPPPQRAPAGKTPHHAPSCLPTP